VNVGEESEMPDTPRLPSLWKKKFELYGKVPTQAPEFILAAYHKYGDDVRIFTNDNIFSAFVIKDNVGVSLLEGAGLLCCQDRILNISEVLINIKRSLGVKALYFPLLYHDLDTTRILLNTTQKITLHRRPSSVIDWTYRGQDLWDRCVKRLGNRAKRRFKAFERAELCIETLEGEPAVEAIGRIEHESWKSTYGQDMHTRGQFDYYRSLIMSGTVKVRTVRKDDKWVAYRLDNQVRDTVFCLKWSYNENFRKFSPGFALIAQDIETCYRDRELKQIDLYGSPDQLKDSVSTDYRTRIDLIWPQCSETQSILQERARHDIINEKVYRSGQGIRAAYKQHKKDT